MSEVVTAHYNERYLIANPEDLSSITGFVEGHLEFIHIFCQLVRTLGWVLSHGNYSYYYIILILLWIRSREDNWVAT